MNLLPSQCPICNGNITITKFHCDDCDTAIEGRFAPQANTSPFSALSPEQLQFVATFVKCEGKLNRMEDELNLSYPTLRSRLLEVIRGMGYEPGKEETAPAKITDEDRKRILDELDSGKIDAPTAMKLLQGNS